MTLLLQTTRVETLFFQSLGQALVTSHDRLATNAKFTGDVTLRALVDEDRLDEEELVVGCVAEQLVDFVCDGHHFDDRLGVALGCHERVAQGDFVAVVTDGNRCVEFFDTTGATRTVAAVGEFTTTVILRARACNRVGTVLGRAIVTHVLLDIRNHLGDGERHQLAGAVRAVLLRWVPAVDFFEVAPRGDDVEFALARRERREVVTLVGGVGLLLVVGLVVGERVIEHSHVEFVSGVGGVGLRGGSVGGGVGGFGGHAVMMATGCDKDRSYDL